jgi:phosphate transport system protein
MIPLEYEIDRIKNIFLEMLDLVRNQMVLTRDALLKNDVDMAQEVIRKEGRVNSYELTIDRECEDFLALHTPVAADLRLTIAILKMSGGLERIGDHAYGTAVFVYDEKLKLNKELLELAQLKELFDDVDAMLEHISKAFEEGNVAQAKAVFKKDKIIDKVNRKLPELLQDYMKNSKADIADLILLARIIGKLERSGDLIKNMAEEIIFYLESKVIKHRKKNKKIQKRFNLGKFAKE